MEAVHVLLGVDGVEHFLLVEVLGQRQLAEDAVDLGVFVELGDELHQVVLAGVLRQVVPLGVDAQLAAGLLLGAHVDLGGRVGPDEDGYQAGHHVVLGLELGDLGLELFADLLGDFGALDEFCCHWLFPLCFHFYRF